MSENVRTSLVVNFATDLKSDVLQLAIDSRPNGLNKGITTFYKGDSPGFLMYKSSSVKGVTLRTSEGATSSATGGTETIEEYVTLAMSRELRLSKPRSGSVTIVDSWGDPISVQHQDESVLILTKAVVAVALIRYTASFSGHRLTGASGNAPVLIVAIGKTS